ncbi:isoprenylcysteine carboxylmethyltransferase family protein [Phenylobacterium sp.]|uniref:methyltransferase family protein n=1 Tax=Phenylobacterium sp. TaxID=1871053 RepID=UPI0025D3347F|nr:isoprenylcysteine carboxylmethyltransferase family protein [Phenylobacterium sp.]MBX3483976.1 isoprenylcysteine carboxylmethyltransferase family protein [Phenylobacterium sp.]
MKRSYAVLGSALFLVVAPGTLAGLIPWWLTRWEGPASNLPLAALGGLVAALGLALLIECFGRFALQGRGTPAPLAPPDRLVVTGAYRRVRNPMYVAVTAMVLGQAALFADWRVAAYGLVLWLGFHAFVLGYEEPTLRRQFPDHYAAFFAAVPRWRPRLRPWTPG